MGTEDCLSWHGMQGLDTPELQLRSTAILSLCYVAMQYYHACMFRSVCGMLKLLCPSVVHGCSCVDLGCQLD